MATQISNSGRTGDDGSWLSRTFSPIRRLFNNVGQVVAGQKGTQVTTDVLKSGNPQRYLDPEAIARFGLTPLVARRIVEGFISGLHKSPFHGFSVEFADHREYVAGDDLKYLDWPLYARTDHYYIKRYEEETNVRCYVLLDRSASMAFGTTGMTKWDYGCFLSTCLSYLMLKQQDAVGFALVGDAPGAIVPARSRRTQLNQIMRMMIQNPPEGQTDLATSLRAVMRNIKRRSIVVVVSDLIDDPDKTLKAIRMIGSQGHDVLVFHLLDPAEADFSFDGSTLFRDMETGEEIEVDPAVVRLSYIEHMQNLMETFRKGLNETGISYTSVRTSDPFDHALWAYLQQRVRLGK